MFDNKIFLSFNTAKKVVESYLNQHLNNFVINEAENYGMSFSIIFSYNNKIVSLLSDRGDLTYKLIINNIEINLVGFEPLLVNIEWFSEKNILFVLNTIKRYLETLSN
ncbi:MAG: hypothetical protein JNK50_10020 [Bacteroidia bacterium]|nr:hypothetical protein [Bacteroidia bacterium]